MVNLKARGPVRLRAFFSLSAILWLASCGTSAGRLKMEQAREAYSRSDFKGAETLLASEEVLDDEQSRLEQYLWLSSVAIGEGFYEKAIFFLERSRELARQLRSDRGFEFSSPDYRSNPVEFSRIHFLLVAARVHLADSGRTPAWSLPEMRAKGGRILVRRQEFPERTLGLPEIEELRTKARADLLAWDSHLTELKRSYGGSKLYHSDIQARVLASFIHGKSHLPRERRTAELLVQEAARELEDLKKDIKSYQNDERVLSALLKDLSDRAIARGDGQDVSLFFLESGVLPKIHQRKVLVGLSTLFRGIEDPYLRGQLEQIGLRVLLHYAPEFGLAAFGGAIAGAATADPGEGPRFISDAVDESFGFQISFPELEDPLGGITSRIELQGEGGREWSQSAPVIDPVQEILAREFRERSGKEWREKALKVGLEYLAILIPAVVAYDRAAREGDWIRKLAILTGYFIAKKTIDRLNSPDLRSWSLMPQWVSAACIKLPPGRYGGQWVVERHGIKTRVPLGPVEIPSGGGRLILHHLINLPASVKLGAE